METDHKPRLLIVSYLFPPNGGIAVQRALSLAKYLPENGFEVHILKARNAASPADDAGPELWDETGSGGLRAATNGKSPGTLAMETTHNPRLWTAAIPSCPGNFSSLTSES